MSSSILHSQAGGIHPGAFVQSTEPDTTDVQDGVLWIDTSAGPPYQLKRWDASATVWHPVQMDATGYPLPLGNRVEERIVPGSSIPDPSEAPAVEIETVVSGLPAGTYIFAYTFVDAAGGETLPSPSTAVTSTGPAFFAVFRPTLPDGVYDINVYLLPPSPSEDIATGFVVNFGGPGTIPPYAITGSTPESFLGTPQPPEANTTGTFAVTVVDPVGNVGLQVPLPTMTATPAGLVGKDPATDLPAFCPTVLLPRARADILTDPAVPTTTGDLCTQLRCGVADACTGHLLSLYNNWARWLSPLFALLGTLAVAAFIEEILPMLLAEEASASTLAVWQEFKPEIQGVIGLFTGNLLPTPTSDLISDIQKMLFCQLVCEDGVVRPTAAQIGGWRDAFLAYPDWAISSLQGQLLELLTKYTPLEDWLIAAESATTSSACDSWTCP